MVQNYKEWRIYIAVAWNNFKKYEISTFVEVIALFEYHFVLLATIIRICHNFDLNTYAVLLPILSHITI